VNACRRGSSRRHTQLAAAVATWVKRGGAPIELIRATERVISGRSFDLDIVRVLAKRDIKRRGMFSEVERSSLDLYVTSLAEVQKSRCSR
jgi:hypothetical protein